MSQGGSDSETGKNTLDFHAKMDPREDLSGRMWNPKESLVGPEREDFVTLTPFFCPKVIIL